MTPDMLSVYRSASYWSSKRSSANSPCDDLTFMVEPHCGSLEAHIAHVTQSDSLVTISFLARYDNTTQEGKTHR